MDALNEEAVEHRPTSLSSFSLPYMSDILWFIGGGGRRERGEEGLWALSYSSEAADSEIKLSCGCSEAAQLIVA